MSMLTYTNPAQRVGLIKGQILAHALHVSTLETSGEVWTQPTKAGDTVIFRQIVPYGATAANPDVFNVTAASHLMQEGVNINADSLITLDTSATVQKYGATYVYTERQESLGEDNMPQYMKEQLGERLGLVREKVYIGAVQGGTNRFWSGGTTRATTDEPITRNLIDRVVRNLTGNHGRFVKQITKATGAYGTQAVQACYVAYGHSNLQQDIERVPGFKAKADYGSMMGVVHENELGAVGNIRFVLSPDMPFIIDSGAAIAGTLNQSTSGTNADVYQLFVVAKDAWGHCAFRGLDAFKLDHIPAGKVEKIDPTGERGYVSGTFYDVGVVTHNGWIAVVECTISSLA